MPPKRKGPSLQVPQIPGTSINSEKKDDNANDTSGQSMMTRSKAKKLKLGKQSGKHGIANIKLKAEKAKLLAKRAKLVAKRAKLEAERAKIVAERAKLEVVQMQLERDKVKLQRALEICQSSTSTSSDQSTSSGGPAPSIASTSGSKSNTAATEPDPADVCAVCLDDPVHPVTLPCTHVFCFLCCKGLTEGGNNECSLCRQVIPFGFLNCCVDTTKVI